MKVQCPHCRETLILKDRKAAECLHGCSGSLKILYLAPAAETEISEPGTCVNHSGQMATTHCEICMLEICDKCRLIMHDGTARCPKCRGIKTSRKTELKRATALLEHVKCSNHPEVSALAKCSLCEVGICETCGFEAGEEFVCPDCAIQSIGAKMSEFRNSLNQISLLAAVVTFALILFYLFLAVAQNDEPSDGAILMGFIIFISTLGTATGISSYEKFFINPTRVRVSIIWNCVQMGLLLLMSIMGLFYS